MSHLLSFAKNLTSGLDCNKLGIDVNAWVLIVLVIRLNVLRDVGEDEFLVDILQLVVQLHDHVGLHFLFVEVFQVVFVDFEVQQLNGAILDRLSLFRREFKNLFAFCPRCIHDLVLLVAGNVSDLPSLVTHVAHVSQMLDVELVCLVFMTLFILSVLELRLFLQVRFQNSLGDIPHSHFC